MNVLKNLGNFFLCMLKEDCEYSIKKFLVYIFSVLAVYLVLFTAKDYYELLIFVGGLLGIRTYERLKSGRADGVSEEVAASPDQEPSSKPDEDTITTKMSKKIVKKGMD